jgi:hypothetical protein
MFRFFRSRTISNGTRIETIECGREESPRFVEPSEKNICRALQTHGVVIIREAVSLSDIAELFSAACEHGERISRIRKNGEEFNFPDYYQFHDGAHSWNLTAIDPWTAGRSNDMNATQLWHTLSQTRAVRDVFLNAAGPEISYMGARVRAVIPGHRMGKSGQLPLHLERHAKQYDGVHNIWMPLIEAGITTNVDVPGLQLFIGRRDFFKSFNIRTESEILGFMSGISHQMFEERPAGDDEAFFYRPRLKAGDVAFFDGFVPHTGFIPSNITRPRVCFDMRFFPKSAAPDTFPLKV